MKRENIKRAAVLPRLDGIARDVGKLEALGRLAPEAFAQEDNLVKAQFYLRRALEGVFHIGSHILSRIPGGRATEYKEIALKLGAFSIVDKAFADDRLKDMAGYRNRLTHFYADVTAEEIQKIIQERLADFEVFMRAIREVMEDPGRLGLSVE